MRYVKAETILPDSLINEIQKYIQGEYIYIPAQPSTRKKWGQCSGTREQIRERNNAIRAKYRSGYGTIETNFPLAQSSSQIRATILKTMNYSNF